MMIIMNNNEEIVEEIINSYKDTFWKEAPGKHKKFNYFCIILLIGLPLISLILSNILYYLHDWIFETFKVELSWSLSPEVSATLLMFGATISIFLYNNYKNNREIFISRSINPSMKVVKKLYNLISLGFLSFFDTFVLVKDSDHEVAIKNDINISPELLVYTATLEGYNNYPYVFLSSEEIKYIPIFVKHYIMEHIIEYDKIFSKFPELLADVKEDMYHMPPDKRHRLLELFEYKKPPTDDLEEIYNKYNNNRNSINEKIKNKLKNTEYASWDYNNENQEISIFLSICEVKLQKGELLPTYDTYPYEQKTNKSKIWFK